MSRDNPAQRYKVTLCANCHHPGGQHFELSPSPCRLCDECDGWVPGEIGTWSDLATDAAEATGGSAYIVKTDGAAGGKGVLVTREWDEAYAHIRAGIVNGAKVSIELAEPKGSNRRRSGGERT